MNADDVVEVLERRYRSDKGWVTVTEVALATNRAVDIGPHTYLNPRRRIDMFAYNTWYSEGFRRVAIEIKVAQSDLQRELDNPRKRFGWELLAHQFYFAVPAGLVEASVIPDDCGLIEVWESGTARATKGAPKSEAYDLPDGTVASLLREATDQRTVDRCGVAGCHTHGNWFSHHRGHRIHLCDYHHREAAEVSA